MDGEQRHASAFVTFSSGSKQPAPSFGDKRRLVESMSLDSSATTSVATGDTLPNFEHRSFSPGSSIMSRTISESTAPPTISESTMALPKNSVKKSVEFLERQPSIDEERNMFLRPTKVAAIRRRTSSASIRYFISTAASNLNVFTKRKQSESSRVAAKSRAERARLICRQRQAAIYNFLERPHGCKAVSYHILMLLLVFCCLILSVLTTIPEFQDEAPPMLYYLELVLLFWFSIEYGLRIWCAGCRSRYQGWIGRLRFAASPFCVIDIVVIGASLVVLGLGSSGQVFAASAIRSLRFFQILRMLRIDRRGGTWKLLGSVVYAHRQELITTMYIGFLGLIFASFLVYMCEKNVNDKFSTFADALWWGVITLCTVGYGDKVPTTWTGKMVGSVCALMGISFFALPAGILGSGFALKVQQQQRQKHMTRRRMPAAGLIQSRWRLFAANDDKSASWGPYTKAINKAANSKRIMYWNFTTRDRGHSNNSLISRLARRVNRTPSMPAVDTRRLSQSLASAMNEQPSASRRGSALMKGLCMANSDSSAAAATDSADNSLRRPVVPERHKRTPSPAPYLREQFQRACSGPSAGSSCFDTSMEDDIQSEPPPKLELTTQQKNAIRFIRRLKYMTARKNFREAQKPYDVKDVIEQYSAGHADLLSRVRSVQGRLDVLVDKSPNESPKDNVPPLASRFVRMERQVDDIETKLDLLIHLYLDDKRKSFGADYASYGGTPRSETPLSPRLFCEGDASSQLLTGSDPQGLLKPPRMFSFNHQLTTTPAEESNASASADELPAPRDVEVRRLSCAQARKLLGHTPVAMRRSFSAKNRLSDDKERAHERSLQEKRMTIPSIVVDANGRRQITLCRSEASSPVLDRDNERLEQLAMPVKKISITGISRMSDPVCTEPAS